MIIHIPRFKNGARTALVRVSHAGESYYVGDLLLLDSGRFLFSPYPEGVRLGLSSFRADNINNVRLLLNSVKK